VEGAYIRAAAAFLEEAGVTYLQVRDLEGEVINVAVRTRFNLVSGAQVARDE